ncbi:MAG: hypothetical protein HC905_13015 [Bacteroidales bacterium]|nr:hypothetical protein [Bacteroidales bacterium]
MVIVNPYGIESQHVSDPSGKINMPDIGFYPEGGSLIEDVPSIVGVKAVNPDGLGINVSGTIITSKGDTVAKFATSRFGMGSFSFTSNRKLKYFAIGKTDSGVPFRIEMPEPLKTGYAISLSEYSNQEIKISIRTNPETLAKNHGRELVIVGKSHNTLCLMSFITMSSVVTSALLPKRNSPKV